MKGDKDISRTASTVILLHRNGPGINTFSEEIIQTSYREQYKMIVSL